MLDSGEGGVLSCGAFVDGSEVLPVVEDVSADLLGCFHGGCAENDYAIRKGVSVSAVKEGNLVGVGIADTRNDNTKAIYLQVLSGENLLQVDQFAFLDIGGMNQRNGIALLAIGWRLHLHASTYY